MMNTAPMMAARLRRKRSKMMRPWLRRFCTSSVVISRYGSISSSVVAPLSLSCSDISMETSPFFSNRLHVSRRSRIPNTRVHYSIEDICYQVEDDDKARPDKTPGDNHRAVTAAQTAQGEQAHARPGKDALGNGRAARH